MLGHALLSKRAVCLFCELLVRIEAWRTVSPCLHPARLSERLRDFLQARYGIGFSIPYRGCVRPTSATYCLSNRQPAFSVLVSCSGHPRGVAIHEMRSLTFHDVQARFGRIDASRWGLSPRNLRSCMSRESEIRFDLGLWHPCRHFVSLAPPSQAIHEPQRRGLGCVLPPPREGYRPRNNPRCLPSVAPAEAVQLVIDPGAHGGGISPLREPHQLEWVGPMKSSPCHSKRSGRRTPCDACRPRLPPRGVAPAHAPPTSTPESGPTMRFSEPRFRLPISATRFRHAGTPVSRRSSSVRGCRPCPRLLCSMTDLRRTSKSRRAMPSAVLLRTVPRGRRAVPFGAGSRAYGLACWEKRGAPQITSRSSMGR